MGPFESDAVHCYPPLHVDYHAKGHASNETKDYNKSVHDYDRQNLDVQGLVLSAAFR